MREWFEASFDAPTPAQAGGWPAISSGANTLICAPTGSGKTLAAFLWGIDRLSREPERGDGTRIVYVSPLKALSYDIERNLRAPLAGIGAEISVALRTGDTPQKERQAMRRNPPDILITTPESLYLILSSGAREMLGSVEAVIVDEIHAVAQSKRGSHLALTLERLENLAQRNDEDAELQRIGLSATQRPLDRIAQFLVGPKRECEVVDAGRSKELDLEIRVPVEDMTEPGALPRTARPRVLSRRSASDRAPRSARTEAGSDAPPAEEPSPERIDPGPIEASLDPATNARIDLARHLPRAAAPGPGAHLHDHLRQQPPRRRAARQAAQRARERGGAPRSFPRPSTRATTSLSVDEIPEEDLVARAHHGSLSHEERAPSSRSC